jgi:2-amino-4-hydroxy-6-hydroxymethyldihydropteridine diphosphokinase
VRAFLGLGSNQGDRAGHLRRAVGALPDVVAVSRVYVTEPVGGPAGQEQYLNVVVELETELGPHELLDLARRLEADAGRSRMVRWGPRTLDVDVLLVVVPHPRMWDRRFVVEPLAELAPELIAPGARDRAGGDVRAAGTLEAF